MCNVCNIVPSYKLNFYYKKNNQIKTKDDILSFVNDKRDNTDFLNNINHRSGISHNHDKYTTYCHCQREQQTLNFIIYKNKIFGKNFWKFARSVAKDDALLSDAMLIAQREIDLESDSKLSGVAEYLLDKYTIEQIIDICIN